MGKRKLLSALFGLTWLAVGAVSLAAQPARISPRNANYTIDVRLDREAKTLVGHQVVTWRNIQSSPTDELWFHLYWNGWRNNRSTWLLEDGLRGRSDLGDEIEDGDWGWIEVDSATLVSPDDQGRVDLMHTARYLAPDDANREDRTVWVLDLPGPVRPGEEIQIELEWRAKIPRTFARTGFRGDFFFLAHWFPKLAVYESDGWNCHQYHAGTEYFSDYGNYDVSMTVPDGFVLGATGRQVARTENTDGTITFRYEQRDVHAFTWTTSPDFLEVLDRFESPDLPAVDIRLLIQPEHRGQADRHLYATKAALSSYGTWFGPYPYGHVTVVDPAWGSGAGGMEYPTLFTAGTRLFNPFGGGSPEGVTIHEAGHQFWYGLVGNDEFEDAWLDEGLNTFSTNRTMFHTYGERQFVQRFFSPPKSERSGFLPVLLEGFSFSGSPYGNRIGRYREYADIDRQDTPSYLYHPAGGSALSYSKTALWLGTLERLLGWDRLQPAMSRFFEDWQFAHPRPPDFFNALQAGTGEDLEWFADQVFRSSERFDYAVDSVKSTQLEFEGFVEDPTGGPVLRTGADSETDSFRTEVIVRRHGTGIFPVDILLVFEDEEEVRVPWDGRDRWRLVVVEHAAKLRSATVDPDDILLLDLDRTNNSRLLESDAGLPALKWASRWLIWLEDFLTMLSFFG